MTISVNDIIKLVRKEPFDIRWNTILTIKDDNNLNKSNKELMEYLLEYIGINGDDSKIFLIVKNDELGYLYSRDYLLALHKSLNEESKSALGVDSAFLPGQFNITISNGKMINYICPINGCNYKIQGLDLQNPRYMCEIHEDEELVKEKNVSF